MATKTTRKLAPKATLTQQLLSIGKESVTRSANVLDGARKDLTRNSRRQLAQFRATLRSLWQANLELLAVSRDGLEAARDVLAERFQTLVQAGERSIAKRDHAVH